MGNEWRALMTTGLGAVLLVAAWRGHVTGRLRAGRSGFKPFRPTREGNPLGFYFYLLLYTCIGAVLVVRGVLALVGLATPLK